MTADRPRAWNSSLPVRAESMKRTPFKNRPREAKVLALSRPSPRTKETGFSRPVKLAVRKRAGNGEAAEALCEACGTWLGRYGGEVQHRLARGSGGSTDAVVNGIANAVLLCGSGALRTGCHGACEDRDRDMRDDAGGFWIRSGNGPLFDPRYVPILLATAGGSGVKVWLTETGEYGSRPPEAGEAA